MAYAATSVPQLLPLANSGPVVAEQPLKRSAGNNRRGHAATSQEDAERAEMKRKRNRVSCEGWRKKKKMMRNLNEKKADNLEGEYRGLINHYNLLFEEKQIKLEQLRRVFMTNLDLVETNPDFASAYRAFAIEDEANKRATNAA